MNKENYQRMLDQTLQQIQKNGQRPKLLLHSCCAPCSSYVLDYLSSYFDITIFYYNPNISPKEEFVFRAQEQENLIKTMPLKSSVSFLLGDYDTSSFFALAKGHELEPEGGARCKACYQLRLQKTAETAKQGGFDYFTTTLSISPHKDSQALNQLGKQLSETFDISYLFSDFKKRDGYRLSCQLSQTYGLYRQDYCGCVYSKLEMERKGELKKG
ncbi:MAG: epoxyqueuosine reductase QueH [Anaerotignum sp.]